MSKENAKRFMEECTADISYLKFGLNIVGVDFDELKKLSITGSTNKILNKEKKSKFFNYVSGVNSYKCTINELEEVYKSKSVKQSKDTEFFWNVFFSKE
jgi:hypothetical protein